MFFILLPSLHSSKEILKKCVRYVHMKIEKFYYVKMWSCESANMSFLDIFKILIFEFGKCESVYVCENVNTFYTEYLKMCIL